MYKYTFTRYTKLKKKQKTTQYGVFFSSQTLVADRLRGCVGETIEHSGGNITKPRQNVTAWVTE